MFSKSLKTLLLIGLFTSPSLSNSLGEQCEIEFSNYLILKTRTGLPMIVFKNNDAVSKEIRKYGGYEIGLKQIILDRIIKPGDKVIEVGAYIGDHTIDFANIVGPTGKVYSYEMNKTAFDILQRNVVMNGFSNWVVLRNVAVGNEKGEVTYAAPTESVISSTETEFSVGSSNIRDGNDKKIKEKKDGLNVVKIVSLDEDLKNIHDVRLIKSDAEGYEPLVLAGAKNIIKNSPNIDIQIEWNPYHWYGKRSEHTSKIFKEIYQWLTSEGFKFYSITTVNGDLEELTIKQIEENTSGLELIVTKKDKKLFNLDYK